MFMCWVKDQIKKGVGGILHNEIICFRIKTKNIFPVGAVIYGTYYITLQVLYLLPV